MLALLLLLVALASAAALSVDRMVPNQGRAMIRVPMERQAKSAKEQHLYAAALNFIQESTRKDAPGILKLHNYLNVRARLWGGEGRRRSASGGGGGRVAIDCPFFFFAAAFHPLPPLAASANAAPRRCRHRPSTLGV